MNSSNKKTLDIGKVYIVKSPTYGLSNIEGEYPNNDIEMRNGQLFLVLDLINDNLADAESSFYHYKILWQNKVKYTVVMHNHPELENYLKEFI